MNKLYLDVETGGLSYEHDALLQIACVPVVNGERLMPFSSHMKPPSSLKINDEALKINQIKRSDIISQKPEKEVLNDFIKYIDSIGTKLTFCAYNASFDHSFIKQLFIRNGCLSDFNYLFRPIICDVLVKARNKQRFFPGRVPNLKLTTLTKFFKISHENAHEALSDVLAMIDLDDILDSLGESNNIEAMSYRDNCKKYLDSKYITFNPDGDIFIQKYATMDKQALRFILSELWEIYGN